MVRKKPYTTIGIKRLKCFRCGKQAETQWTICSDGNQHRPLCRHCDIELNEMVLKFMGFPNWEEMMEDYKKKLLKSLGEEK